MGTCTGLWLIFFHCSDAEDLVCWQVRESVDDGAVKDKANATGQVLSLPAIQPYRPSCRLGFI